MRNVKLKVPTEKHNATDDVQNKNKWIEAPIWETPTLEDVSEQVMAQPYIRFT